MTSESKANPKGGSDQDRSKKAPNRNPGTAPSSDYGKEGTNKTLPEPKADNEPSEELGNTRHIGKSPYTRG